MTEAILFDFTELVARKLGSTILEEIKLVLGVEYEIDRIKSNLSSILAILRDAEKQQSSSDFLKNWLEKLQDVLYDIDDLLDEIATEVAIHNMNKGHVNKQVRKFFSRSNHDVILRLWAHQIKSVCKKLDRVADERKNFVLFTDSVHSSESSSRETHTKECELTELSDEMGLMIFLQLVSNDGEEIDPTLMNLAKKIVEKSKGVPLLLTALGNQLRGKTNETEWHLVIKKLEEGHDDITNILKLSYEQLPSHLKLCFRFCSFYGKGTEMPAIDVLLIWMALGFLPEESLEAIGWKCIQELSSRSLFQKIKNELIPDDDEFSGLVMHDFIYDLAKSMVGDELATIDGSTKEISENTRFIRIDQDYLSVSQSSQSLLNKAKKARLLTLNTSEYPLSKSFLRSIISNLKCLRVLDLENSQFEELPRTIGYMKHLRYLCLQNNTRIILLPNSICDLLNLQTLALSGCVNLKELPTEIGRLENLRYLSVTIQHDVLPQGIGFLTALRTLLLKDCPRLAFLPLSTNQLMNLDMLLIEDCKELNLVHQSWSLEGMKSLRIVLIQGLPKFQKLPVGVKGLPFTSLHILVICDCEGLTDLTDWIEYFTSLRALVIVRSPNLVLLPYTVSMLKRLETLFIEGYPDLVTGDADEESC